MRFQVKSSLPILLSASLMICAAPPAMAEDRVFRISTGINFLKNHMQPMGILREGPTPYIRVEDCPDLTETFLKRIKRVAMETMVLCHALRRADIADVIELVVVPNEFRAMTLVAEGVVDAHNTGVARESFQGDFSTVLSSDPILQTVEYSRALLTAENRTEILSISSPDELVNLTGMTVAAWKDDIAVLETLPLAELVTAPTIHHVGPMIAQGRADFALGYITQKVVKWGDVPLHRVEGLRLKLPLTLYMVFAPDRRDAWSALQSYIRDHRAMDPDPLYEAYYQTGFLTREFDHWEVINTPGRTWTTN